MEMDPSGQVFGRYRLVDRVGEGTTAVVYRAVVAGAGEQPLALKVLAPSLVSQPGFRWRLERDVGTISAIGHDSFLPVYECGDSGGFSYVAMELAEGGTLRDRLLEGPMDVEVVLAILGQTASGLRRAHEARVVHLDLKPSNILFDGTGRVQIADFGLARLNLGFAMGTPGYMAPEQALGEPVDHRADVYALATLAFEMLTGTRLLANAPAPALLQAAVEDPIPSARERRPELPADVDEVLARGLAKRRQHRHQTVMELLWDLTRVLGRTTTRATGSRNISDDAFKGSFVPAALTPAAERRASAEDEFERSRAQLMILFDSALSAAVAVDESSFIVGWNSLAEATFGWKREEILARSLSSTIVPPQYREAHERGFRNYLETGEGKVLGRVIEITAMHRDGREFPVELSISPAARAGGRALFVAFVRDISLERRAKQLEQARDAVAEALAPGGDLATVAPGVLEAIGGSLGWKVGVLWLPEREALRSRRFWSAETVTCPALETAVSESALAIGQGLAGRAWRTTDVECAEDVLHEPDLPLALSALRAGMRSAVAVPVPCEGEVLGVLEFYGADVQKADEQLCGRLSDIGRKVGTTAGRLATPRLHRVEGGAGQE
jgi:PAS domain S-box-containing protein